MDGGMRPGERYTARDEGCRRIRRFSISEEFASVPVWATTNREKAGVTDDKCAGKQKE
jgi:hypothetical protein